MEKNPVIRKDGRIILDVHNFEFLQEEPRTQEEFEVYLNNYGEKAAEFEEKNRINPKKSGDESVLGQEKIITESFGLRKDEKWYAIASGWGIGIFRGWWDFGIAPLTHCGRKDPQLDKGRACYKACKTREKAIRFLVRNAPDNYFGVDKISHEISEVDEENADIFPDRYYIRLLKLTWDEDLKDQSYYIKLKKCLPDYWKIHPAYLIEIVNAIKFGDKRPEFFDVYQLANLDYFKSEESDNSSSYKKEESIKFFGNVANFNKSPKKPDDIDELLSYLNEASTYLRKTQTESLKRLDEVYTDIRDNMKKYLGIIANNIEKIDADVRQRFNKPKEDLNNNSQKSQKSRKEGQNSQKSHKSRKEEQEEYEESERPKYP